MHSKIILAIFILGGIISLSPVFAQELSPCVSSRIADFDECDRQFYLNYTTYHFFNDKCCTLEIYENCVVRAVLANCYDVPQENQTKIQEHFLKKMAKTLDIDKDCTCNAYQISPSYLGFLFFLVAIGSILVYSIIFLLGVWGFDLYNKSGNNQNQA